MTQDERREKARQRIEAMHLTLADPDIGWERGLAWLTQRAPKVVEKLWAAESVVGTKAVAYIQDEQQSKEFSLAMTTAFAIWCAALDLINLGDLA